MSHFTQNIEIIKEFRKREEDKTFKCRLYSVQGELFSNEFYEGCSSSIPVVGNSFTVVSIDSKKYVKLESIKEVLIIDKGYQIQTESTTYIVEVI